MTLFSLASLASFSLAKPNNSPHLGRGEVPACRVSENEENGGEGHYCFGIARRFCAFARFLCMSKTQKLEPQSVLAGMNYRQA